MNQLDAAWLAGLVEGEGNIGIYSRYALLQITNTDKSILEHAGDILSQNWCLASGHEEFPSKRKDRYWLQLRGGLRATHEALCVILPHLVGRKRKIAEVVLAFTSSRLRKGVHYGKKLRLDAKERILCERFRVLSKAGRG